MKERFSGGLENEAKYGGLSATNNSVDKCNTRIGCSNMLVFSFLPDGWLEA